MFAIACENCPKKASGSAVAVTNFFVTLGAVIFQPAAGWILSLDKSAPIVNNAHVYTFHDYELALLVLPVALVLSIVFTLFLKETYCQSLYPDELHGPWLHHKNTTER